MALIKLGGLISDIRGSVGGTVFSRNRSGAIARQRTTPVNPNSPRQAAAKAIMSFISQLWRSLVTLTERNAWGVYASNVPETNKLGEVIRLSGFNQFCKSNGVLLNAGLAQVTDAPILFTKPGADPTYDIVASEAGQTLAITFDDTRDWVSEDGAGLIVEMGIPQDDSIEFFNGPWRVAGTIAGAVIPPVTGDTVAVPFEVTALQKIFTRAKIVRADGRVSEPFRVNAVAGA